jgi:2-oxoglutarate dehydrogenase E1 component
VPQDEPPRPPTVSLDEIETAVPAGELRALNEAILARPASFSTNPKLERVVTRRREALNRPGGVDWAHAEALACGAILADGTPIRMTGQDTERGTFSQRHFILHDVATGEPYVSLQHIPQARASFAIYNSPLTETAVLGFEYGYSVHAPEALVLWEAQFGDFANVAQVVIDQFLVAARAKWRQEPGLVLLLPHGYEGQGPEHSSARLERFLQLAAEDNIRIVNCTTAAQYFHILRLQAKTLDAYRRPLIILTPKSLLRQPKAASSLDALSHDRFHPLLLDEWEEDRSRVERLLLCSGKIAVDLIAAADKAPEPPRGTALARLELLYPFPERDVAAVIGRFPNLREVIWVQEEPQNMGAWPFILTWLPLPSSETVSLHYVGRPPRASTAEGSAESHAREQARIVEGALHGAVAVAAQGGAHAGGD